MGHQNKLYVYNYLGEAKVKAKRRMSEGRIFAFTYIIFGSNIEEANKYANKKTELICDHRNVLREKLCQLFKAPGRSYSSKLLKANKILYPRTLHMLECVEDVWAGVVNRKSIK